MVKKGLLAHDPGRARAAHLAETVSFKVPFVLEHGRSHAPRMDIDIPKSLLTSAARPFVVQAQHSNPACRVDETDLLVLRDDRKALPGELVAVLDDGEVRAVKQRKPPRSRRARVLGVVTGLMRRYPQPDDE
jgi:SOS-response transcriptional repressor LexA